MTVRELQNQICDDLRGLFRLRRYSSPYCEEQVELNVFRQQLPKRASETDDDPFPYLIVRLDSGSIDDQVSAQQVTAIIIAGIYDDDTGNGGHDTVLELLEVMQQHYEESPTLGAYRRVDPISWALQDEDSYPYYFGALQLTFEAYAPRIGASKYT